MPRPKKHRRVEFLSNFTYFKPAGVPLRQLEEVNLFVEELEALRLKDNEGLDQEICAQKMGISRATFQRILSAARFKVTSALLEGKAIRVEGGHFQAVTKGNKCRYCQRRWFIGEAKAILITEHETENDFDCF